MIDTAVDYWAVLGVAPGTDKAGLDRALAARRRLFHPDRVSHLSLDEQSLAAEELGRALQAHDVLTNPRLRSQWETTKRAAAPPPRRPQPRAPTRPQSREDDDGWDEDWGTGAAPRPARPEAKPAPTPEPREAKEEGDGRGGASATAEAERLRQEAQKLREEAERREAEAGNWDAGARGEEKTAAILQALGSPWVVLHDLAIPGSKANVDHIVLGPTGVTVIDTKMWAGRVTVTAGVLMQNGQPVTEKLRALKWETEMVARCLGAAARTVPVRSLVVVHGRDVGIDSALVDSVRVVRADQVLQAVREYSYSASPLDDVTVAALAGVLRTAMGPYGIHHHREPVPEPEHRARRPPGPRSRPLTRRSGGPRDAPRQAQPVPQYSRRDHPSVGRVLGCVAAAVFVVAPMANFAVSHFLPVGFTAASPLFDLAADAGFLFVTLRGFRR